MRTTLAAALFTALLLGVPLAAAPVGAMADGPASHGLDGAATTHGLDGGPASNGLDGAPPTHYLGGAPDTHYLDRTPDTHYLDRAPTTRDFDAGTTPSGIDAPALAAFAETTVGAGPVQLADSEYVEIQIRPTGDAEVTLGLTLPAANDSERAAFQQTAEEFEAGEYDLGYGVFESVVPEVRASTERPMTLGEPQYNASIENGTGRLEQRFTWHAFAGSAEGRIQVSDGFVVDDRTWLGSLEEGQRLVLRSPAGYSVAESPSGPEISQGALVWTGPLSFDPSDFAVSFEPDVGTGNGDDDSDDGGGMTVALLVIGVLVLLVLLALLVVRRWDLPIGETVEGAFGGEAEESTASGAAAASEDATDGSETGGGGTASGDHAGTSEGATGTSSGGSEAGASEADAGTAPPTAVDGETAAGAGRDAEGEARDVDPELLSDEERVTSLLERNGGRMKQANIVKETGWSNAKVSQLLSSMDEAGEIDKLRIGRENLISLPDVDVTDGDGGDTE